MRRAGLPVVSEGSHILPLLVGSADAAQQAAEILLQEHAISIQAIVSPSVPRGEEALRITPSPAHTDEPVAGLVAALDDVWSRLGLPRA